MRILLKCPTRSRPQRVLETLSAYVRKANHPELLGVAVSCDVDDTSMTRNLVQEELMRTLRPCAWSQIFFSPNKTKIEACNADVQNISYPWDIVVLVSDDMLPQVQGYDDVIRNHMQARFPDTNGILWFNDGFQGNKLNTLTIFGREMYNSFGYIYHPSYKSLFCDTELTDLCTTTLANRTYYVDYCIIRHEHPGTGFKQRMDALYATNQKYWTQDMYTYISRKAYPHDWSILIPTMTGRDASLQRLLASIREKTARIAPDLRYEFSIFYDNKETSVGAKRQSLLQGAKGKYVCFIDDDDDITDAYIEDVVATIRGNHPVMRLRGQIAQYTFTHSIENKLTDVMARGDVFIRPPNHLNPMMADIAKLVPFGNATRGEDLDWTMRMSKHGFLVSEYAGPDPNRIHYIYEMGSRKVDPQTLINQRQTSYETMLKAVWIPSGAVVPGDSRTTAPVLRLGRNGFVST
jgi:glycosyltransferase involved in cell wall biosynthesis